MIVVEHFSWGARGSSLVKDGRYEIYGWCKTNIFISPRFPSSPSSSSCCTARHSTRCSGLARRSNRHQPLGSALHAAFAVASLFSCSSRCTGQTESASTRQACGTDTLSRDLGQADRTGRHKQHVSPCTNGEGLLCRRQPPPHQVKGLDGTFKVCRPRAWTRLT